MANDRKAATVAEKNSPLAPAPAEKPYRIIHTIVLGKGEEREQRTSGVVTASEVGGEAVIERLLKAGALEDPDAPVRPSEASELRARSIVIDIARRGRIVTAEGERYTFAGETYSGAAELNEIPITAIADAIVASLIK
jgi:hypothetical protein